jgi:hypothetical protein
MSKYVPCSDRSSVISYSVQLSRSVLFQKITAAGVDFNLIVRAARTLQAVVESGSMSSRLLTLADSVDVHSFREYSLRLLDQLQFDRF